MIRLSSEDLRYGLLAGLFDWLLLGLVLRVVEALLGAWLHRGSPLPPSVVLLAIGLPLVVVYHAAVANHVDSCSPGERIAGRRWSLQGKVWRNPFTRGRGALFVLLIAVLATAPGTELVGGRVGSVEAALVYGVVLGMLATGVVVAGTGGREGLVWLAVVLAIVAGMLWKVGGTPGWAIVGRALLVVGAGVAAVFFRGPDGPSADAPRNLGDGPP